MPCSNTEFDGRSVQTAFLWVKDLGRIDVFARYFDHHEFGKAVLIIRVATFKFCGRVRLPVDFHFVVCLLSFLS